MSESMRRNVITLSLLSSILLAGCAVGSSGDIPPEGDDGTISPGTDMAENNTATGDMGEVSNNANNTTSRDMGPQAPATRRSAFTPSAGGGVVETPRYKARVIVGAPAPAGKATTPRYTIELGAGAQQHGQK